MTRSMQLAHFAVLQHQHLLQLVELGSDTRKPCVRCRVVADGSVNIHSGMRAVWHERMSM